MHKKEQEKEAILEKQKSRIELFYKYNYEGIKKITYTDIHTIPTGTYVIEGYVNDDPELKFDADVDPDTNFESSGATSDELDRLVKKEYRFKVKKVSKILEEQKKKQSH